MGEIPESVWPPLRAEAQRALCRACRSPGQDGEGDRFPRGVSTGWGWGCIFLEETCDYLT